MTEVNQSNGLTLRLWYGGVFEKNHKGLSYVGRSFRTTEVDSNLFCWSTLVEEAEKCDNYRRNIDALFYMVPGSTFEDGLKMVFNDKEARLMLEIALNNRLMECYIVSDGHVTPLLQLLEASNKGDQSVNMPTKITPRRKTVAHKKCPKSHGPPQSKNTLETLKEHANKSPPNCKTTASLSTRTSPRFALTNNNPQQQSDASLIPSNETIQKELNFYDLPRCSYDFNDITLSNIFNDYEENADLASAKCLEELNFDELSEDENDPSYVPEFGESSSHEEDLADLDLVNEEDINLGEFDENLIEEEFDDNTDDEELQEAREKLKEWNVSVIKIATQLQLEASACLLPNGDKESETAQVDGHVSDYDNSGEEEDTPGESEEESIPGKRKKSTVVIVDGDTNFKKLKWCVGMRFPNRSIFRDCITRYAIAQGRDLKFDISDKEKGQRLRVRCKPGCPFKVYGSWENRRACFVVKSVDPHHTCQRNMESNRQLKSTWVAKQFLEVFKTRPHWPACEVIETVRRAYRVIIKKGFAYKVKYYAHKLLHGSMKEHYGKVRSYIAALEQSNPTSAFTLMTNPSVTSNPAVFQRLFLCFDALKQGWLIGCRKLLCVDSCFLKTFLGGQLISVVGRDANEQMFPLAWAVVEGENNDSYEWFFQQLKKCLGEKDGDKWTFISDEHPSIITMVANEFPKAEHRHCARHIFANWHKTYRGDEMKLMFWKCAKAYNNADFNDAITAMREVNTDAANAFLAYKPHLFCRAFIQTHTKNDVIVNNMAETFNAYIINARTKHLLYMLEDIRCMLMQRMVNKKHEMEMKTGILCPRVQERLDKEKEEAANCQVLPSSDTTFQVKHVFDDLNVDIKAKTCTCKKWDLTGIPCCHGVAAIFENNAMAEDYVYEGYKRDTYLEIYNGSISPCVGERHWPKVDFPLNPPPIKVGPGRPRKNRIKDPFEDPKKKGKLTKHGTEMSCSICKSKAHNKRKCPDKDKVVPPPLKKRPGRPRLYGDNGQSSSTVIAPTINIHHGTTAQPTRVGRGGRVIRSGRGSRGRGRGGAHSGGRGSKSRVPQGLGVLIDNQGNAYTNVPGSSSGPKSITMEFVGPSTQASTCASNHQ